MIKKALHISLVALLLISTVGIKISKHYSGGELFSVSLFGEAKSCCDDVCDCCSDDATFYHLEADYIETPSTEVEKILIPELFMPRMLTHALLPIGNNRHSINHVTDTSPAYLSNPPAFLQVFRC